MKLIASILSVFIVTFSYGQQLIPIQFDTTLYEQELIVSGIGEYGTTSIQNYFSNRLLFGGYLSTYLKDGALENHKEINRLGVDINCEAEYRNMKMNLFGSEKWGLLVKGGSFAFGSALYSKDAFNLAFNGNSSFDGAAADFSSMNAYFMSFQKIGLGIIDKKTKSSIALNVFNVSNFFRLGIRDGVLTESEDGSVVSLDLNGQMSTSLGKEFNKGMGVGLDIDYRIPFVTARNKKAALQFVAKNLGIVSFRNGIENTYIDSTYEFNGFQINQLYGDQSVFQSEADWMDTLGVQKSISKRYQFLPGFMQVGKIVSDNSAEKWQTFFGVRLYPSLAFNPFLYFGVNCKIKEDFENGAQLSYGGSSNFRVGYYLNYKVRSWTLGIATQDVYGTFFKAGYGKSLLIRLRCRF